jgi:hypothetical protein
MEKSHASIPVALIKRQMRIFSLFGPTNLTYAAGLVILPSLA